MANLHQSLEKHLWYRVYVSGDSWYDLGPFDLMYGLFVWWHRHEVSTKKLKSVPIQRFSIQDPTKIRLEQNKRKLHITDKQNYIEV